MDQEEDFLDFKSLRAKFQDDEVLLLKQPGTKSALPEKPKVLPPPHSPTNCLPSLSSTSHTPSNSHSLPRGARPSLLSSLQGPGGIASRGIVKEEKKVKSKDMDEGKVKLLGKKKAEVKADKEKSDERMNGGKDVVEVAVRSDLLDQKQKKEADLAMKNKVSLLSPGGSKGGSVELVDMSPPPINTTKKKGFLGIGKSVKIGKKRKEGRASSFPHTGHSPDLADPEPVMLLTTFGTPAPPGDIPIRTVIIPPSPAVHIVHLPPASIPAPVLDSPLPLELTRNPVFTLLPPTLKPAAEAIPVVTPPNPIPVISDPPIIDHIPEILSPETIPAPTLPVSVRPTPSPVTAPFSPIPAPPVTHILPAVPSPHTLSTSTPPPPVIATPSPPPDPTPSPPPPPTPPVAELDPESVVVDIAVIVETSASPLPSHTPPPPAGEPSVAPPSLQPERPVGVQERPLSALLALGRAEEMSPPKKRGSEIIFNALEKAKRTLTSPLMTHIPSRPAMPTIEDLTPPPHSPSPTPVKSLPELPPIDYDDQAEAAAPTPLIPALVKGQASPMLQGIAEKGARDLLPDRFVVPPPPPRKRLPEASTRGSPPEKLPQLPSVDLTAYAVEIPVPSADSALNIPEFEDVGSDVLELEAPEFQPADLVELEVSQWGAQAEDCTNERCGNAYEDMPSAKQKVKGQPTKKKKGTAKSKTQAPYNPYAETQLPTEETPKTDLFLKKTASETPEEKQMKKKEKQRFEKEKKERERKEQKEREKKENEMKKFKITGQKEAIYQATVMVASKGHKNDLAVKNGDIVSIIRTTNCPKGRWLARDSTNTYGYISVSDVELDNKEMLEMGKRAFRAISCKNITTMVEQGGGEVASMDSRTSNHYPLQEDTGSFTDDSEEWAHDDDDDEPLSSLIEEDPTERDHIQTMSMPDMGSREPSIHNQHILSDASIDGIDMQVRHEALQKLATFFHKPVVEDPIMSSLFPYCLPLRPEEPEPEEPISPMDIGVQETAYLCKEEADMVVLPPPDLYADIIISDA
ncbi:FYN-binding protein 1-like isoform X2 [Oncorhynchus masou masou]|uniref:FYN-binding protein 1-like isoform X2 n=1 Tax=Oncorhynchus masou masou TaxID=90313 RepID=UPI003182F5E2